MSSPGIGAGSGGTQNSGGLNRGGKKNKPAAQPATSKSGMAEKKQPSEGDKRRDLIISPP